MMPSSCGRGAFVSFEYPPLPASVLVGFGEEGLVLVGVDKRLAGRTRRRRCGGQGLFVVAGLSQPLLQR
jgi:hypothetical protein